MVRDSAPDRQAVGLPAPQDGSDILHVRGDVQRLSGVLEGHIRLVERTPPPTESLPSELNMSNYDRMKMFTDVRKDHPEWARLSVKVGRGVLCRFDRTVQSFYKRCKEGRKPGFPRFKPYRRWRSMEIPDALPSMLVGPGTPRNQSDIYWRLQVKGAPRLRIRDKGHRLEKAEAWEPSLRSYASCGLPSAQRSMWCSAIRTENRSTVPSPTPWG